MEFLHGNLSKPGLQRKVSDMDYRAAGLRREEYEELKKVLGREPNETELRIMGVMWSEHCSYKSTKHLLRNFPIKGEFVSAPMIEESPVNIECRVIEIKDLGSHHMFMAEVLGVHVDEKYLDAKGKFNLSQANPICYSHGTYYGLGNPLGTFGYSIAKKKKKSTDSIGKRNK